MDRLAGAHELLDGPLDDPRTLAGNLRDLRRVNALLGGVRLSLDAIYALVGASAGRSSVVELLDVGTGGADIPVALLAEWRRNGRRLAVTAIDDRAEVLAAARLASPAIETVEGLRLEVADGRSLPYDDRAFDVAHTSLVVHHLEPADAVHLLAEMARVSRRGIVVNDLTRGRIQWLAAWLLALIATRNRYTRHDGPLSVRRAYTAVEMKALLAVAGLRPIATQRDVLRHRYAIAAVRA
ncbi:MAG: methyltransferase domain-containing protein [Chloroflexota bacterium]|nr:methyltransferase domain-containing protein [Chloroflexota bacterium]